MLSRPHYPHLQRKQLAVIAERLRAGEVNLEEANRLRQEVIAGREVVPVETMRVADERLSKRAIRKQKAKTLFLQGMPAKEIEQNLGYSHNYLKKMVRDFGWEKERAARGFDLHTR